MTVSATITAQLSSASLVEAPRCGSVTIFGWSFVALAIYVGAKIFELFDRQLLQATGIVSGHTIKHLFAAAAVFAIVRQLRLREPVSVDRIPAA